MSDAHHPAITAHRLVGNGRTAALVRPDGEVDWWCAPDFDSPPLCWSLLDPDGGAARFPSLRYSSCGRDPAGPTARTTLAGDDGRVEVWDGLLDVDVGVDSDVDGDGDGAAGLALVRLVRGLDADLDVAHELTLGGFGTNTPRWQRVDDVARLSAGGCSVTVTGGRSQVDGVRLHSTLRAPRGQWVALAVAVNATVPPDVPALVRRFTDAEAESAAWLRNSRPSRSHAGRSLDAIAVLRACTYSPTGAVVAAVTTSLPEAPGHDRQFDYRYSWLRDASLAVSVAALLGKRADAERYLAFVRQITGDNLVPSGPLVDVRGGTAPGERQVEGVAGWAGSQPVRVGNEAAGQVQYDALGLLVEAVSVYLQTGGRLDDDTWRMVRDIADQVAAEDPHSVIPSNGIWETRERQPLVGSDIGRWLVLDRALKIARWRKPWTRRRRWRRSRDIIASRVLGVLDERGLLPRVYGDSDTSDSDTSGSGSAAPDSAGLMAVVFGLLDGADPRASRLVDQTVASLDAHPWIYRYPPGPGDGFAGREGAFLPVSFWVVTALAFTGQVDAARQRLDDMCLALPRLLAEEVDPGSGHGLGNVPLVWSHAELARSLYVLDAAALRARYGVVALSAWRLVRYLRMRWADGP